MKRKFYEQLDVKIENKKSNNSFLNREKYQLLIQEISQLKRGDCKKQPEDFKAIRCCLNRKHSKTDLSSCRREFFNKILCTKKIYLM